MSPLVLASASDVRRQLLERAGVPVEVQPARVDEDAMKASLDAEGATPRDIADALAEMKASRVAARMTDRLVLGCDQVLDHGGRVLDKPTSRDAARAQLSELRGQRHTLLSAAVVYDAGRPVWRHVGTVHLQMRAFTEAYLESYLERNWPDIKSSVGGYKLESEGIRLFDRVEGDYFTVLGIPLLQLLSYLTLRGDLPG